MEFRDVISKRRAVNFFDSQKPVSHELLKELVETAALSPSGFNLQPWSLIVLREQEEKMRLRKLAWNQPKVSEAPVTLIMLADRNGWEKGHPFVEKNFKEMVKTGSMKEEQYDWLMNSFNGLYGESEEKKQAFACKNTAFFAMALMLAARDMGLDTHPMDGFDHDGVRKAFNIPENYWIPLLLSVGYFDEKKTLHPPKWRKTFEEIVVKFD